MFGHMKNFLLTARNIIVVAIIGVIATLLGQAIMMFGTGMGAELRFVVSTASVMLLTIIGVVIYDRVVCHRKQKTMLRFAGFNPIALLWGLLLIVSMSVVMAPLMRLLPDVNRNVPDGVLPVVYVVLVAPILEEILFRGKLFSVLRSTMSPTSATLLSALLFGVMHANVAVSLEAFFVGVVLSYIYILKGSLFAPILLHVMNNVVAYVMMSFSYQDRTIEDYIGDLPIFSTIYIVASAITLLGVVHVIVTLRKANRIAAEGGDLIELSKPKKSEDAE